MAEPNALAEAFEKLAKILAESNSGANAPRQEVSQKLEMSPLDMKLGGDKLFELVQEGFVGCGAEGA